MTFDAFQSDPVIRIVDDDACVRRALSRLVESMGGRAETFASPAELLSQAPDEKVRCLILDVQLPGMDGFELHERVVTAGQQAPVIFITAHPSDAVRARATAAKAVAFLGKPFDDDALFEAIRTALERRGEPHGGC